ncbi:class I SAM-dependent methyltransferase [Bifidobacterium sp. 82T24]|uniref:class I SAM-dependent methyltransferase n=1 Tax=Bifidobacterium pluvialisilvae TaxID=2834436 RepID=UPI001C559D6E|nr:class I SAM-dependent methyltransferase [Bifidobacterium pluvialisilvae]MBW3089034.1 class I SAM-dependent methyltransferase [Bifidobacterium pluvialisilvae]
MSEQTLFHGKAQAYADARPDYPDATIGYVGSMIADGAVVADVGAGTGKFTVPIARYGARHGGGSGAGSSGSGRGYEVRAVEPDADMRAALTEATRPYANVTVVDGSAEHTNLSDASVDAVVCAQALHWFDHDAFLAECRRISRGRRLLLVSIYNVTSFDSAMTIGGGESGGVAIPADGLSPEQMHEVVGVSGRHFRETTAEFFHHPTIKRFPNPIHYTRDAWRAYMDSHSHSPLPTDPIYPAFRAQVDAIFDERSVDGILTDDNVTMVASELLDV